jgi:hypothetical protein
MRLGFRLLSVTLISGIALTAMPHNLDSQQMGSAPVVTAGSEIPENPQPQNEVAEIDPTDPLTQVAQNQSTPPPTSSTAPVQSTTQTPSQPAQGSSSSQQPGQESANQKSQREKAEEQLKLQEKQRVMGVMATFNTTRNMNAVPLSSEQKFKLFFKSATDPWPFLLAGAVSGIGQANDSYAEWGQGAQGYAKRYGAAYSDAFIGNFFGNAVFTSWWHEDPRYFQKGSGTAFHRFLWAAGSTVWCKRDSGKWGPNYANVVGNLVGAAISNVYYPATEHTVSNTINDGLTVSAEGIVGAEVIEFWPDMVRAHNRKKAEKLARQAAQQDDAQSTTPSTPK